MFLKHLLKEIKTRLKKTNKIENALGFENRQGIY